MQKKTIQGLTIYSLILVSLCLIPLVYALITIDNIALLAPIILLLILFGLLLITCILWIRLLSKIDF